MRIKIKENGGHGLGLALPTSLIISRLGVRWLERQAREHGGTDLPKISGKTLRRLRREIRRMRRVHREWCLVDVKSADGDTVKIYV